MHKALKFLQVQQFKAGVCALMARGDSLSMQTMDYIDALRSLADELEANVEC